MNRDWPSISRGVKPVPEEKIAQYYSRSMANTDSQPLTLRRILLVIATGVGAGFLSGLFGVGGGLVIVPALMAVLGMDQRRASATSLAAIIVTAAVGSGTYALHGEVSWAGAALLVVGALVGSQVGVWLLRRLPAPALPWILIGFTVFVIVSQYLHVPTREGSVSLTPASCTLMIRHRRHRHQPAPPHGRPAHRPHRRRIRGSHDPRRAPRGHVGIPESGRDPLQHLPAVHHCLDDSEDASESARPGLSDSVRNSG